MLNVAGRVRVNPQCEAAAVVVEVFARGRLLPGRMCCRETCFRDWCSPATPEAGRDGSSLRIHVFWKAV